VVIAADQAQIEQELIDAIVRDPYDDGALAVYADWLAAHGQLRGELATLQLAAEEHPGDHRITEVATRFLREHAASFLGELPPVAAARCPHRRRCPDAVCATRGNPEPRDDRRHGYDGHGRGHPLAARASPAGHRLTQGGRA
jgi:uncharacterized protein (TIGR02996 family)